MLFVFIPYKITKVEPFNYPLNTHFYWFPVNQLAKSSLSKLSGWLAQGKQIFQQTSYFIDLEMAAFPF